MYTLTPPLTDTLKQGTFPKYSERIFGNKVNILQNVYKPYSLNREHNYRDIEFLVFRDFTINNYVPTYINK